MKDGQASGHGAVWRPRWTGCAVASAMDYQLRRTPAPLAGGGLSTDLLVPAFSDGMANWRHADSIFHLNVRDTMNKLLAALIAGLFATASFAAAHVGAPMATGSASAPSTKSEAKAELKDAKAESKAEKKMANVDAKVEKKEAKTEKKAVKAVADANATNKTNAAEANKDKAIAAANAKESKAEAKAEMKKDAAK